MYKNEHGTYPEPTNSYACLGEQSHYQRTAGWSSAGGCYGVVVGNSIHPIVSVDSDLNDKLRKYMNSLPDASYATYEDGTARYRGPQYFPGPHDMAQIIYVDKETDGEPTCAWGGVLHGSVGGDIRQCTIFLR